MIKLAAFDVDGTLIDRDVLPDSAVEALHRLKSCGVHLTLCTGRSNVELNGLRGKLGIEWAITCNGCLVTRHGEAVFGKAFPGDTIRHFLDVAERLNQGMLLYGATGMYINRENDPKFRQAQQEIGMLEPAVLQKGAPVPDIYQCIIFCSEKDEAEYLGGNRDHYYVHRWRTWAVDINMPGMNKAVGLQHLARCLNVRPEEIAVFGDGRNDIEMFGYAGMSIAMGNAPEEVKRAARYVTRPIHEDGIAYAVEQWIMPELRK